MKQTINIVLSSNDNYILGLAATIESIICHSSKNYYYQINVLHSDISEINQNLIKSLAKQNTNITFIDVKDKLKSLEGNNLYVSGHVTVETYYRLFIPEIFNDLDKLIYIDCDLVVRSDIAELYNENTENYIVGVVKNPVSPNMKNYRENVLGVDNKLYFNSGVMLINIKEFIKENIKDKCLNLLLTKVKTPYCWDQDLMNAVCYGRVKYLDPTWNVQWTPYIVPKSFTEEAAKDFKKFAKKAKIFHYTTVKKPWTYLDKYCLIWWFYILKTKYRKQSLLLLIKILFPHKNQKSK